MKKSTVKFMRRAVSSTEFCSVPLCSSSAKFSSVSFHSFPADAELRAKWEVNIRRERFTITNRSRVCSRHFLTEDLIETPSGLHRLRKGALPVLFEWNGYQVRQRVSVWERRERPVANCTNQTDKDVDGEGGMEVSCDHDYCTVPEPAAVDLALSVGDEKEEEILKLRKQVEDLTLKCRFGLHRFEGSDSQIKALKDKYASNTPTTSMVPTAESVKGMDRPSLKDHGYSLMSLEPTTREWGIQLYKTLLKTEVLCQFHTGLTIHRFSSVAEYLLLRYTGSFRLHPMDQLLMTLMKLKLNLRRAHLAQRFSVSHSDVGSILHHWINAMEENTRNCIQWLPGEIIRETTPRCVRERYPGATCIIDCLETRLQKPGNSTSFSRHCSQNTTVKYLVATAPCGLVMFISPAYGGRSSDRFITADSGFLDYLHPGDEVMADRGLNIRDLLYKRKVKLTIPAFAKKGSPTWARTVEVKAHVKSVVRRLKLFRIISQTVPTDLTCQMDKILRICAALCNLRGDIVEGDQNRFLD